MLRQYLQFISRNESYQVAGNVGNSERFSLSEYLNPRLCRDTPLDFGHNTVTAEAALCLAEALSPAQLTTIQMKPVHRRRKGYRLIGLAISTCILLLLSSIPLRLAIAYYQSPHPQAILTLGGGKEREEFTAQFSLAHPSLEIWLSSGRPLEQARPVFQSANIQDTRVHLDYRAADTVTNFTSLVADFKSQDIQHIYLITSDFHMPRAKAIATVVLGSWGIAFTPISIPSNYPPESWLRILRDTTRALFWIITGHTGASLNPER